MTRYLTHACMRACLLQSSDNFTRHSTKKSGSKHEQIGPLIRRYRNATNWQCIFNNERRTNRAGKSKTSRRRLLL